jgi:hypothetical protein
VLPAILDLKADAIDLAKFKKQMPAEAARLVDSILKHASVAVTAAGSGDIGDLVNKEPVRETAPQPTV